VCEENVDNECQLNFEFKDGNFVHEIDTVLTDTGIFTHIKLHKFVYGKTCPHISGKWGSRKILPGFRFYTRQATILEAFE
jgi:hypothetical protein